MPIESRRWNLADHIKMSQDQAAILEAALEAHDIDTFIAVLCIIAKLRADAPRSTRSSGVNGHAIHDSHHNSVSPTVQTLDTVMRQMGLKLSVQRDEGPYT